MFVLPTFNIGVLGSPLQPSYQSDLVGWWKFDEDTGTTSADSSGSNNATLYGDAGWDTGKNGSALQLSGAGYAYTGSGNGPTVGDNGSLSFWVKLNASTGGNWICSQDYNGNPSFLVNGTSTYVAAYSHGSVKQWTLPQTLNNDIWYHLAFVYDGTADTVSAYFNGTALSGTHSTTNNPMSDFADGVCMGTYVSSGTPFGASTFNGEIDDVRIYNTNLSATNVSDIWNGGNGDWAGLAGGKLLNAYSNAAIGYSLRQINGNYTGNCLRVRRADNSEQDIGFSSGVIDTSAMETFVGAGDGFVVKWYDQSGNGIDATQSTASKQPKVVSSGTTITSGGKPALEFNAQRLDISTLTFLRTTEFSCLGVCELDVSSSPGEAHILGVGSSSNGFLKSYGDKLGAAANGSDMELIYASTTNQAGGTIQDPTNIADDTIFLGIFTHDGTTNKLSLNDGTPVSNTTALNPYPYTKATIGSADGSNTGATAADWVGKISEVIQWHSSQDGNRSGIKTNINNYYSIW